MFRKFISVIAIALFASTVSANQTTIDTSGLSSAQVAELKAHAAKVVAETANVASGGTVKDVGTMTTLAATWGQQAAAAAEGFSKAFTIAARELGVTVNEFLNTDAGKLTAALIVWKVMGASVASLLLGVTIMIAGQVMARVIYKRLFTGSYKEVQYSRFFGMFTGTKLVRIPRGFNELNREGEWLAFWVMIAASVGSLLIGSLIIS